jgi:hypothetical protein
LNKRPVGKWGRTNDKAREGIKSNYKKTLPDSYPVFLQELKQRIQESQLRASVSVNRELVVLYWRIGRDILVRQEREHWGPRSLTVWPPI